jgi:SAM-dependent methyltransferase
MSRTDIILEWLSNRMPLACGKAHQDILEQNLKGNIRTVLDVGCGRGVFKVFRKFDSVGIEIFPDNVMRAKNNGNYKNILQGDIRELNYPDKSFDAITCLEVIEHLDKDDGLKLLENIERIARKTIIIMTPYGYMPIHKRTDNTNLNHLSGWYPDEFKKRGYTIYYFKYMRQHWGNNPILLTIMYPVSIILRPIINLFPDKLSIDFAAVKIINE